MSNTNTWLHQANASLSHIQPYQPGKPESELIRELGITPEHIIKLNSNESLWGPSPKIKEYLQQQPMDLHLYPDGNGFELKQTLSKFHQIDMNCLTLGNGSNDILELIARAFLSKGSSAIYSQHAFIVYHLVTLTQQAQPIKVAAKNYGHNLDAMLKAITDDTKIIFIANPNNPTGTFIPYQQIQQFISQVPAHILVVLDEAYYDYLPLQEQENCVTWLENHPNLVLVRTLSKIYGLAALRIGYAISHPDLADLFNRVRPPFNSNSIAQKCASIAIQDQHYIQHIAHQTQQEKLWLEEQFKHLNIKHPPSYGNFICAEFSNANAIEKQLSQQGILVRPIGGYELPNHLRISIGKREHNQQLINTLSSIL